MFEGFAGLIGGLIIVLVIGGVVSIFLPPLGALIMKMGVFLFILDFLRLIGLFKILPFIVVGAVLIVIIFWVTKTISQAQNGEINEFNLKESALFAAKVCVCLVMFVATMGLSDEPLTGILYTLGEMDILHGIILSACVGVAVAAVKAIAESAIYKNYQK